MLPVSQILERDLYMEGLLLGTYLEKAEAMGEETEANAQAWTNVRRKVAFHADNYQHFRAALLRREQGGVVEAFEQKGVLHGFLI